MKRPLLRLAAALAAAALAACAGPGSPPPPEPATIEVRDHGVLLPVARISANFVRERAAPSDPQGGHGIELGMTRAKGNDTQATAASEAAVAFGGRTFASPQELRHEFEFSFLDLSYRWRRFFGAGALGIEVLAGIGVVDLDLTVSSATQSARESLSSAGAVGGFGVIWRMRPGTSLQSRIALYLSVDNSDGAANAARLDLYFVQAIGRNTALRAGYASWHVETDRTFRESNVNINFSGPALGLELMF